jgi:hypothetical protein
MGRPIFCRWCQSEDTVTAGEFPAKCAICGNIGRWSTQQHGPLIERRKQIPKGPRVPFTTTIQNRRLFLARVKISAD